jgi:hypothetical protein
MIKMTRVYFILQSKVKEKKSINLNIRLRAFLTFFTLNYKKMIVY